MRIGVTSEEPDLVVSAVLHFRTSSSQMESLKVRSFTLGDPKLAPFVRRIRSGIRAEAPAYDVVEGPMLEILDRSFRSGT